MSSQRIITIAVMLLSLLVTSGCSSYFEEAYDELYEVGEKIASEINVIASGVDRFTGDRSENIDNPLKDLRLLEDSERIPVVEGEAVISFLDIGQGDSTLIQTTETTILIDTGRQNSKRTMEQLKARGIETIDTLILSHVHADHIGNSDKIIDTYKPTEVWWNGDLATSKTFERLVDTIYEKKRYRG